MKKVVIVLLLLVFVGSIYANEKIYDIILINNMSYNLLKSPLLYYLEDNFIKKNSGKENIAYYYIGNYYAEFEIKNNNLYIKSAYNLIHENKNIEISALKSGINLKENSIANWFKGELIAFNYNNKNMEYVLISVNKGIVEKVINISEEKFVEWKKKNIIQTEVIPEYNN